jgi:hypothetical protein
MNPDRLSSASSSKFLKDHASRAPTMLYFRNRHERTALEFEPMRTAHDDVSSQPFATTAATTYARRPVHNHSQHGADASVT